MGDKVATGVVSPSSGRVQVRDTGTGQISYAEKGTEVEAAAIKAASSGIDSEAYVPPPAPTPPTSGREKGASSGIDSEAYVPPPADPPKTPTPPKTPAPPKKASSGIGGEAYVPPPAEGLAKQYAEREAAKTAKEAVRIKEVAEAKVKATAEAAQKAAEVRAARYEGWTAKELTTGKTVDGVYTPSPWGVKGGTYTPPPKAVQEVLAKDRRAIEAASLLAIDNKPIPEPLKNAAVEQLSKDFSPSKELMPYAKMGGEMALYMVPIYGTYLQFKDAMEDGKIDGGEAAWLAGSVVADVLTLTAIGGAAGLAVRGTVGLSRAARVAAAGKSTGKVVLMEVTAPYQVIRHPVATVKGAIKVVETIVRPSKIPLAAAEVSYSTVRLPVKAFASESEAMNVRDVGALAAMQEGKFVSNVGGVEVSLNPARLQSVGNPIAVHTSPDIRPFMEGATISAGREGGLFVAPNVHTRFSTASAYGDMPEGSIRGALIIRDEALLKQLGGSGKIYNKTAEVEAVLQGGVNLPKPSQTLITRTPGADTSAMLKEAKKLRAAGKIDDAVALETQAATLKKQGDKLTLLIYGKPYSAAEIANLKVMGALDNVTQIFTPPAGIKGAKLAKEYDSLNGIRREANALVIESSKLRKAGKTAEAATTQRQANELIEQAARLGRRMSTPTGAYAGGLRIASAYTGRYSPMDRLSMLQGRARPEVNLSREQLKRLRETMRNPELRDAISRRAERVRFERLSAIRESRPPRPPERPPRPPERPPRPPERPPRPPERPPRVPERPPSPRGGSDTQKREVIRESRGAVTWNMGKLHGKDVWHVRLANGKHIVVLGKAPQGAKILADGPGSASKTAQVIGTKRDFAPIEQIHGAVGATLRPSGIPKGASIRFTPRAKAPKRPKSPSIRVGKQYYTRIGSSVAISRRPLGRQR